MIQQQPGMERIIGGGQEIFNSERIERKTNPS